MRRAARWDGWIAIATSDDGSSMVLEPAAFREMVERVHAERAAAGRARDPYDIAAFGFTDPGEPGRAVVRAFADAGATWWLESLSPMRGSLEALLTIVEAGPPGP
jgi:hypothetical protein